MGTVSKPLYGSSCHGCVPFKPVDGFSLHAPCDDGVQTISGNGKFGPDVHIQKGSRPVGAFDGPRFKTTLGKKCRVLVRNGGSNGDFGTEKGWIGHTEITGVIPYLGKNRQGDTQEIQPLAIPLIIDEVVGTGNRGIGCGYGMHFATGQFVNQPGIDGAESQFSCLRALPGFGHMIHDPSKAHG